jgi:hypothetical protein
LIKEKLARSWYPNGSGRQTSLAEFATDAIFVFFIDINETIPLGIM